jgi:Skp family chaperone for outer membrane proteins
MISAPNDSPAPRHDHRPQPRRLSQDGFAFEFDDKENNSNIAQSVTNNKNIVTGTEWIQTQLYEMNMTMPRVLAKDADKEVLHCLQVLLNERMRAKEYSTVIGDECLDLRKQMLGMERTFEMQAAQIDVARQDANNSNSRLNALQVEQRQLKSQWAAEKAELETKAFQALALQQSTLGTMRKKEKDFDALQTHLSRALKDSQKSQKCSIVISKQLPKSWNESTTNGSLRDAEIYALQATLTAATVRVTRSIN